MWSDAICSFVAAQKWEIPDWLNYTPTNFQRRKNSHFGFLNGRYVCTFKLLKSTSNWENSSCPNYSEAIKNVEILANKGLPTSSTEHHDVEK